MAGLDYQYGPPVDYYDRMLPYEIPGQLPSYDPSFMRTSRMRDYHESFPGNDSSLNELAEIKRRLSQVTGTTRGNEPPQEDPSNIIQSLYSGAQSGIGEVGDFIQWLGDALNPALRTEEGRKAQAEHKQRAAESLAPNPNPQGMYDQLRNAALLVAMMETGGATRAASMGKTIPAATETMTAKAPVGGNVWPGVKRAARREKIVTPSVEPSIYQMGMFDDAINSLEREWKERIAPTLKRSSPERLKRTEDKFRRLGEQSRQKEYILGNQQFAEAMARSFPEESAFTQSLRQDPGQGFNVTEFSEAPQITGTGLAYRIDQQGRRRVIPDKGMRGEYSRYTAPTKNTEGFWEDISSSGRRAYDFVNNDLAEVANALLRAPGEMVKYGGEVARGLGQGMKEGAKVAIQDAIQNESPILHRIADIAQGAAKFGRKARVLDEEPMYYVPAKGGGWTQDTWYGALPDETRATYNSAPKESLQRKAIALQERDLPAISDLIERHPLATIGTAGLLGADTLARLGGSVLGYETPSKLEGVKSAASGIGDALFTSRNPGEPWYAAYDWLWGG